MEETLLYTTSLLQTELASLIHYNNELTANKSLILNVRWTKDERRMNEGWSKDERKINTAKSDLTYL